MTDRYRNGGFADASGTDDGDKARGVQLSRQLQNIFGPANYAALIIRRGRMEGFIILDFITRFPEAQAEMAGWLASGELKAREHIVEGLERAPEALNLLFTGGNTGKVIVRV